MNEAVIGVDLGTSSVKAIALSQAGEVLATSSARYPTHAPASGIVEQDPEEWMNAVVKAIRACTLACPAGTSFAGLGLCGHMSVLLALDANHQPVRPALTVSDTRGRDQIAWLTKTHGATILEATGNLPTPALTLPKLQWYRQNEPAAFNRTAVIVGAKDYVLLRLTGHLGSEPTDAGNTLLLDSRTRSWNYELARELKLPARLLPRLSESMDVIGGLSPEGAEWLGLPRGLPVIAGLADMAASVLGSGLLHPGRVAITLGTSAQITAVVDTARAALQGGFTLHPHATPGRYYVMASLFTGGLALRWWTEQLAATGQISESEAYALAFRLAENSPPGARGALFLPRLTGAGSPRFDPEQRASFSGLSLATQLGDMTRAILEGVTFTARTCLELLESEYGQMKEARIAGGGFRSELWRQIFADVLGRWLWPLKQQDAGALGVALATGHGIRLFPDLDDAVQRVVATEAGIQPRNAVQAEYQAAYDLYLATTMS